MSVSHIIILGVFITLGSIGLAMMQSALSVVWKAASLSLPYRVKRHQVNSPVANSATTQLSLARVPVKISRPLP